MRPFLYQPGWIVPFTLLLLFIACNKEVEQDHESIPAIISRHTTFDISPFPFVIARDSIVKDDGLSLGYNRHITLKFNSVVFDSLTAAIRNTQYFNHYQNGDDVFLRSTWERIGPNATHGIWYESYDRTIWFEKRYDDKGVDVPEEFLIINLEPDSLTVEMTYGDSKDNLYQLLITLQGLGLWWVRGMLIISFRTTKGLSLCGASVSS